MVTYSTDTYSNSAMTSLIDPSAENLASPEQAPVRSLFNHGGLTCHPVTESEMSEEAETTIVVHHLQTDSDNHSVNTDCDFLFDMTGGMVSSPQWMGFSGEEPVYLTPDMVGGRMMSTSPPYFSPPSGDSIGNSDPFTLCNFSDHSKVEELKNTKGMMMPCIEEVDDPYRFLDDGACYSVAPVFLKRKLIMKMKASWNAVDSKLLRYKELWFSIDAQLMENRVRHSDVNLFWKCKHSTLSLIEVEVGIRRGWIEEKSVTHPPTTGQCGFQGGAVVEFLEKEFGDTSNSLQPIIACLEMVSLEHHGNNLERQLLDNIEWLGAELKKIVKLQRLAADSKKSHTLRILPAECGVMQLDSPCEPHIPKTHTISRWEKDYGITRQLLQQRFGMSRDDAAKTFKVSTSTLKRACRDFGINRWPNHSKGKRPNCSLNQKQHVQTTVKKHKGIQPSPALPPLQPTNTSQCNSSMSVKVTYQNDTIRFPLSSSSTIIYLEEQLETKFKISLENMSIKYQDEEDEWITLTCDSELMHGMEVLRSCGKTVIRMMVTPKFN